MLSAFRAVLCFTFVLISCHLSVGAVHGPRPPSHHEEPLFLTPYLNRGDIHEGQRAARNPDYFGKKESYSGYLTVNNVTDTHIFFWYFKAENMPSNAPVILWLQGGPGASSLVGAFLENGPYKFISNSKVLPREYHWSARFHVLYLDNPVGAGYSFTEHNDYADDENKVGKTLYEALTQFFGLFPELRQNNFFIAGESYAGKFVPALAHHIHTNNPHARNSIRLRGIALGNAIIDPATQLDNGDVYYQLGFFDKEALRKYDSVVEQALKYIKTQSWERATEMYYKLVDLTYDASGLETLFNLVKDKRDIPLSELEQFLDSYSAKQALHVGQNKFHLRSEVAYQKLNNDRTQSVKSWFVEALENYNVLVYNGQLDLNKPYSGMVSFMSQLQWSGAAAYRKAPRTIWRFLGDVAGYSKTVWHPSGLDGKPIKYVETVIRNAGHLVPRDQPLWAMAMMVKFAAPGENSLK